VVALQGQAHGGEDGFRLLADAIREAAWELAVAVVQEGLESGAVPSLARVDELDRLGDIPAFIGELGRHVVDPQPGRTRPGGRLAEVARDHARHREGLGFAQREVVQELLLLRRVLWRFLTSRQVLFGGEELLVAENRLDDLIDTLVIECVVAYFERATAELSDRARRDPLTKLLNHQAFWTDLERELDRARRFDHGLAFLVLDLDWFKEINDTLGHPVGDRVLQCVADALGSVARAMDLTGRIGGDEFAVGLVEAEAGASTVFVDRVRDALAARAAAGDLPAGIGVSAGSAHFPSEADSAVALFELADTRLYEGKRSRAPRAAVQGFVSAGD